MHTATAWYEEPLGRVAQERILSGSPTGHRDSLTDDKLTVNPDITCYH
jgi:hypothetical protein